MIESFCNLFYKVGVHIADVTHFVKPGTAIDEEASKRGTTVYLTDKVGCSVVFVLFSSRQLLVYAPHSEYSSA